MKLALSLFCFLATVSLNIYSYIHSVEFVNKSSGTRIVTLHYRSGKVEQATISPYSTIINRRENDALISVDFLGDSYEGPGYADATCTITEDFKLLMKKS